MSKIRTVQIGTTTVEVEHDEKPRPMVVPRAMLVLAIIALPVMAPLGVIVALLAGLMWVVHRTSEKARIEAIIQDSARRAASKHEDSQVLAYKSLGS